MATCVFQASHVRELHRALDSHLGLVRTTQGSKSSSGLSAELQGKLALRLPLSLRQGCFALRRVAHVFSEGLMG